MTTEASRTQRFEEHLERLEAIVRELESGELPIEASLERYELGIHALRQCHRILGEVERKIELLVADRDAELAAELRIAEDEADQAGEAS